MADSVSPDFSELNEQTAEAWDRIAEWWDDKIGDGNSAQDLLIQPATERLLDISRGERILDVACGAGRFARRMADLGAEVVGVDHSEGFLKRARERSADYADHVEYKLMNATDKGALLSLGDTSFDAAVCTMGLMDMASIEPLIATLPRLLKPKGRFVFSVTHPVFNSGSARMVAEEEVRDGKVINAFGVMVTDYAAPYPLKGVGVPGQPEPYHQFHRPIGLLFNTCFRHGFALDGLEETTLPEGSDWVPDRPLSWAHFSRTIPPFLVARMRLL